MIRHRVTLTVILFFISAVPLVAQDHALGWTMQPVFAVGGIADSTIVMTVLHPKDVAASTGNRLAILDRLENQVILLDAGGHVERRLGRRGPGPGELSRPSGLTTASDGGVWVWDSPRNALVGFSLHGAPLDQRADIPGVGLVQEVAVLPDGQLAVLRTRRDSINLWWSPGGKPVLLAAFVQPPSQSIPPGNCPITDYPARPVFTPGLSWAVRNGTVATNVGPAFAIRIHGGSHDGAVLTRAARPQAATADLAMRVLGPGYQITVANSRQPCLIAAKNILAAVGFASQVPAYDRLMFAANDTLWAIRYALPGESRQADIYSLAHGYVGTIALGRINPITVRTDGTVVSLEADASDVPRLVVYRVRR